MKRLLIASVALSLVFGGVAAHAQPAQPAQPATPDAPPPAAKNKLAEPHSHASVTIHKIPAGKESQIGSAGILNADCTVGGKIGVALVDDPQHGTVRIAETQTNSAYPPSDPRAACNSKLTPATGIFYTPAAGYTGPDVFTVEGTFPGGAKQAISYMVDVQ